MKILRPTPSSRKAAMTPSAPSMLICPMRRPVEARVAGEPAVHGPRRIDGEGVALAQREEPGDRIDVAAGEHGSRDRRRAQPLARPERRRRIDLCLELGCRIEEEPARAVE